jgi:UDP-N-acetylmuramate dehydrogenase
MQRLIIKEQIPLAQFSTINIGGNATFFTQVTSEESLIEAVNWARERELPIFILGGGSNIIVADDGFPGLVIQLAIGGIEYKLSDNGYVDLRVGAGEEWDQLVHMAVSNNFAGIECLSGIPGSVGATPIQNVGAYGQEVSQTIVSVTALELSSNQLIEIAANECGFGYRTSRFKYRDNGRFVITKVTYRLIVDGKPTIRYGDLQRYFSEHQSSELTLSQVREGVIAVRRTKGMVVDKEDKDSCSVGSFFVNPLISNEEFEDIKARMIQSNRTPPTPFPAKDGSVKISAAWLIENSGFTKGFIHGNVGLSTKHTLAIINRGGGRASEVIELSNKIKAQVFDQFGVTLTPEPVFVGFDL